METFAVSTQGSPRAYSTGFSRVDIFSRALMNAIAAKPKLVLHVCCAPDEAHVVKELGESRELYCFFCNPNVYPREEYVRRLDEARKVAQRFSVQFSAPPFDPDRWEGAVKGLGATAEGGERCRACFLLRLDQTARFCREIGWPSFTSVMSISPHKNIRMLNETGQQAALAHGVIYEPFDFKKKDGFLRSIRLSKELGLYRQDYCGCRLSLGERDVRKKARSGEPAA